MIYDSEGNPRYPGLYMGLVVNNVDPEKLGRVTLMVPGIVEPESEFAYPLGAASGPKQNGSWDIPKKGTGVGVFFHQGDIDVPFWIHGWFPGGATPTPANSASAEVAANHIKCHETDQHLVVLDSDKGQVLVKDKRSGLLISMKDGKIELGGEGLVPTVNGVVLASTKCQFSGAPHVVTGDTSLVVLAKK